MSTYIEGAGDEDTGGVTRVVEASDAAGVCKASCPATYIDGGMLHDVTGHE